MVRSVRELAAEKALHENEGSHRDDSQAQSCAAVARPARTVRHRKSKDSRVQTAKSKNCLARFS